MKKVIFDFRRIGTMDDFYKQAKSELALPEYFGNNLDALWDSVTGDMALPVELQFINLSLNQLEQFDPLIALFEDAAAELGDNLLFEYYLEKEQP